MEIKKLQQLCQDEAFITSLVQLDTPQQVQNALKDKGINLTIDQINQINDFIIRYQQDELTADEKKLIDLMNQNDNDELNEQQLEAIAGGFIEWIFLAAAIACGVGIPVIKTIRGNNNGSW